MTGVPKALTMSESVEWQTPEALFDACDAEFGPFTLDPATALGYHTSDVILNRGGTICVAPSNDPKFDAFRSYSMVAVDGLAQEWTGRVWLNHPYGRFDWQWMKKAHDSVRYGDAEIVVALVPVKSQMKWWHKYVIADVLLSNPRRRQALMTHDAIHPEPDVKSRYLATTFADDTGADIVRFCRGRLRFGGAPSSAPFCSAIVVWRK